MVTIVSEIYRKKKKKSRKGKSIAGLMRHIRDNHHVMIGGNSDKRELLNMGYFHQHYVNGGREVPIWAVFELITLGNLGNFIERLNGVARRKLSEMIGIRDDRFDDSFSLLPKHLYIIKDLRNAIAHNRPVFDCRFRKRKIARSVLMHLEEHAGVRKINFQTITDYILLLAYYMDCLKFGEGELKSLLCSYEKLLIDYKRKARHKENYYMIFDVDSEIKIEKFVQKTI